MENKNYLMFENDQNNCWVDAAIVLIAHSTTFKNIVETFPDSQIKSIISTYNQALAILNDNNNSQIQQRIDKTRKMLRDIQESTLHYLKTFLKFKPGEPESAFCALLSLIYHDNSKIKENTSISWIWQKNCDNCESISKSNLITKPIITLPKVNNFHPECPTSVYTCTCKKEQEMKLIYKELPNCVVFHFEKGAGKGIDLPLSFTIDLRQYHLTCVVMLEKSNDPSVNHFVTWIRNSVKNTWLDCNDLNTCIVQFSEDTPKLELQDVYMCVYEAFDDFGKISHEISADEEQTENVNAELIYLSDEGEDFKSASNSDKSSKHNQTIKNEETLLNLEKFFNNKDLIDNNRDCNTSEVEDTLKMLTNETSNDLKNPDFTNIQNHSSSNNKCISASEEFSDLKKHKNEIGCINYQNKSLSKIDTEEVCAKSEILNTLNQESKLHCTEIFVGETVILNKCEIDNEDVKVPFYEKESNAYEVTPTIFETTESKNTRSECSSPDIIKTRIETDVNSPIDTVAVEKLVKNVAKTKESNGSNHENEKLSLHLVESLNSKEKEFDEKTKTKKKKSNMKNKTNEADYIKNGQKAPNLNEASARKLRKIVDETVECVFAKFHAQASNLHQVNHP